MLGRLATVSVRARPVVAPRRLAPVMIQQRRTFARDDFNEREKSMEDKAIREHEKRLLDDMAKQLEKKKSSTGHEGDVEKARSDIEDQMLELRKELLGEIREVQDSVAELSFRVKRIESKQK